MSFQVRVARRAQRWLEEQHVTEGGGCSTTGTLLTHTMYTMRHMTRPEE
jgi:hypothetical protein